MESILAFLKDEVDGKTLHTEPLEYQLDGGKLKGIYSDQMSFSNLRWNQSGCTLDMFIVANEKVYDAAGALHKDEGAVSLFRYELARRQSTGAVTGLFRFISASGKAVGAEAVVSGIYDIRLQNGELWLKEDQALYRDQNGQNGPKPVAFASQQRFYTQGGKLRFEYNAESFAVDPATLLRSPGGDDIPAFVSKER